MKYLREKALINKVACAAASLIALTLFAAWSWSWLAWPPEKGTEERQYTECSHKERAGSSRCVALATELAKEPEAPDAEDSGPQGRQSALNDFIKDKRNLNAQEGIWRSSNFTVLSSYLQVLLTGIGIVLVYLTLKETREALKEARKTTGQAAIAAQAATESAETAVATEKARAYIEFEIVKPERADGNTDTGSFAVEVWAVNYGRTPAMEFGFDARLSEGIDHDKNLYKEGRYVGTIGPGRDNAKMVARLPDDGFHVTTDRVKYHVECTWRFQEIWGKPFGGCAGYWYQQYGASGKFSLGASGPTALDPK